jgi:pimeloyl-ACP methyl ester carboxylesterase
MIPTRQMSPNAPSLISVAGKRRIAYQHTPGSQPGVIFMSGFMSGMTGTKAMALEAWCRERGLGFTRFDYSGHGASSGQFQEGTIGTWLEDAIAVLDMVTQGPQVIVGSSMGGWLALLLTMQRPERVAGVMTIACATDFTERLLRPALSQHQLEELEQKGLTELPTAYQDSPYIIGKNLLDEGRNHLLLSSRIDIDCPVCMVHGTADVDVPPEFSQETLERISPGHRTRLLLIEAGDHRLSRPEHLGFITDALATMINEVR